MKNLIFFLLLLIVSIASVSQAQLGNYNMYLLSNQNTHITPYSAVWGYVAPDGREYAIIGCFDGTSFVDITDADNIHEVGFVFEFFFSKYDEFRNSASRRRRIDRRSERNAFAVAVSAN